MTPSNDPLRGVYFITLTADLRNVAVRGKLMSWGAARCDSIEGLPEGAIVIGVALAISSSEDVDALDALLRRHPTPPVVLLLDLMKCREFVASRPIRHVCWVDALSSQCLVLAAANAAADAPLEALLTDLFALTGSHGNWLTRTAINGALAAVGNAAPHSVVALASKVGCSSDHLTRVLRQARVRANRLVRWNLLIRAFALRMRGLSWNEVAKLLGFGSESNFAHFVKSLTGRSPQQLEASILAEGRTLLEAGAQLARSEIFI